jgi:hypothetical protein
VKEYQLLTIRVEDYLASETCFSPCGEREGCTVQFGKEGQKRLFFSFLDSLARKEKQLKEIFSKSNFAEQSQDRRSLFRPPGTLPPGALSDMGTTTGWGSDPPPANSGQFINSVADPGCLSRILPSRISGSWIQKQKEKRGVEELVVMPFFAAINFTKLKIILFLKC